MTRFSRHSTGCLLAMCALALTFAPDLSATSSAVPVPITGQMQQIADWLSGPIIPYTATIVLVVAGIASATTAREEGAKVFGTKVFWLAVGSATASLVSWLNIGGAVVA